MRKGLGGYSAYPMVHNHSICSCGSGNLAIYLAASTISFCSTHASTNGKKPIGGTRRFNVNLDSSPHALH
jgi:hypothetical protein